MKCTLNNTVDDTKLSGASNMLRRRDVIQRDLEYLEKWACANFMKFKSKVLQVGQENLQNKYKLEGEQIKSSLCRRSWVCWLMRMNMIWHCALALQKTNHILGWLKCDQHFERDDSSPLSHSHETPPPTWSTVLRSREHSMKRTWTCWSRSGACYKYDQRVGASLLLQEAERTGVVHVGEESSKKTFQWPSSI